MPYKVMQAMGWRSCYDLHDLRVHGETQAMMLLKSLETYAWLACNSPHGGETGVRFS